tara:strand:- start:245 stop:424 length:180 start_codon:yes stop_codon:yes gene_type:complete
VQIDVPKIEKRSQNQTANERVLIGLSSWVALLALGSPLIFYLSAETPAGAPFCSAADPF